MPRHPATSSHAENIPASTFVAFGAKLRERMADPEFVPLHLGDTYPLPPEASRRVSLDDPALHRYGPVPGTPALREAAAADLTRQGLAAGPDDVFVTPGATGALDVALNASLEPGDEVLVLTPTWPLIFGLLHRRGAVPVQVDVDASGWLPGDPALLEARLEAAVTPRTAGISLCNPNNPSGFVYSPDHLSAVGAVLERHGLWLFYDAVYADLVHDDRRPLGYVEGLRERTFVATSYSKTFGLAGQRVGLLTAPPGTAHLIPRLITNSTYHTGTLAQAMAAAALAADPEAERETRRALVREGAARTVEALAPVVAIHPPEAGAFALIDLRERVPDDAALLALLDRCLDAGVSLAPGGAFGAGFTRFARVCYSAIPPDRLQVGLERLRSVLERAGG